MGNETRPFTAGDEEFFERLRQVVLEANRTMNLTRITERGEFLQKHVLDSLLPFTLVPVLAELPERGAAADVGSGAGFPGLVLARFHPGWSFVLFERTQKKASFLEGAARTLGLGNVEVVARDSRESKRRFDVVTARAVGRIAAVTRAAGHLLAPGGLLVHYKGGDPDAAELAEGEREARKLGLVQEPPFAYSLPPDARRSVVISRARRRKRGGARPPTPAS